MNSWWGRFIHLFILSLFVSAIPGPALAPRVPFAGAQASANPVLLYDFEQNVQGWYSANAVTAIERSNQKAKSGQYSMKLTVNLGNTKPALNSGEVKIDSSSAINMSGRTLSAWVYAPLGSRGDTIKPNGIHLFVEDTAGRRLYGTWKALLEGGWFQITLFITSTKPACGDISTGFDPTHVSDFGINIALPAGSSAAYTGPIYIDQIEHGILPAPQSAHFFDFEDPDSLNRLPTWGLVPGWNATALGVPAVQNNALALSAHFRTTSDPERKGAVGITFSPLLDLAYKENAVVSADIRFDPAAVQVNNNCPFVVSIWVYDNFKQKWFVSDEINIGAGEWTPISFDLAAPVQYRPGIQDYAGDTATLDAVQRVVFQFWANAAYDGRLLIDNIAIGGREVSHSRLNHGIVNSENGQFILNGAPFRFVGANAEYLFTERSSAVAEILDRAASLGASVVRTWGFSEGCEDPLPASCQQFSRRFQPARGKWNETEFAHFDQIVALAAEHGLRLIIPLANNWGEYGGRPQYVAWLAQEYPQDIPPGVVPGTNAYNDLFYTNPHIKQWYKDYITHFVNRTNSITGVRYSEDPTIFAWELINEPRAPSDISGATLHQWIVEMSDYLNSLDAQHMIGTGEEGWYVMPKSNADARARLEDGTVWQNLPGNYWEYGVNWKPENQPAWSSDGVDFISDHSSTDTQVCWQAYAGDTEQTVVQCEMRKGVPNIDFAGMHLYISSGATSLYLAPYCDAGFDPTICNANYDRPYHQAFLWMAEHQQDASALGKPLIVGEFGFNTSGKGTSSSGSLPKHTPPFEASQRARMFGWYYDEIYRLGIGGALFWNLAIDGFPENIWDGADAMDKLGVNTWRYNPSSDSTSVKLCPGPEHVTQGRYSLCANYDIGKGNGKAFIDRFNISSSDGDWSPEYRHRLRVDVYSSVPLSVIFGLITGESQTWYESVPQTMAKAGWNTITLDITDPIWKSANTGWQYTGTVNDQKDIRQVSIGISGYSSSDIFYVDNLRHIGNDSLALYAEDESLGSIKAAACRNWLSCVYLPGVFR